ncbi:MAG: YciI family protein [Solirubrobacteraceae bacterium]
MSRYILLCQVDETKHDLLAEMRPKHYEFLLANRDTIVFGGPAREAPDCPPELMVIVVETVDQAAAAAFIASEPYNANGAFTSVRVRPWSQVLPEPTPGSLQATYDTLLGTET